MARSNTRSRPLWIMVQYLVSTSGKAGYLMETRCCKAERQETTGPVSASISVSCQGLTALSLSVPVTRYRTVGMIVMAPCGEHKPGTWHRMETAELIKLCWSAERAEPRLDLARLRAYKTAKSGTIDKKKELPTGPIKLYKITQRPAKLQGRPT